jgi:copper oxidase (laccase) domain-containing protein
VAARSPASEPVTVIPIAGTPARCVLTTRVAGDVRPGAGHAMWASIAPLPWIWVRQVHGGAVLTVPAGGRREQPSPRCEADGTVSVEPWPRLAMFAADCALVGMASPEGVIGIAHCGWRGLVAGIIEAVADEMRLAGASSIAAIRGPCIGPECYEFGEAELELVVRRHGPAVRSVTARGALSLDLPAGVRLAAAAAGVATLEEVSSCTACDPRWFSFRARHDDGRHAMVVTGSPS